MLVIHTAQRMAFACTSMVLIFQHLVLLHLLDQAILCIWHLDQTLVLARVRQAMVVILMVCWMNSICILEN